MDDATKKACEELKRFRFYDQLVLHLESMTIDLIDVVFEGCWRTADGRKYFADVSALSEAEQLELVRLDDPIVLLKSGDAFFVRPGIFVQVPEDAAKLHISLVDALKKILTGFAIAARGADVEAPVALGLAKSALRQQLRRLVPGGNPDGES